MVNFTHTEKLLAVVTGLFSVGTATSCYLDKDEENFSITTKVLTGATAFSATAAGLVMGYDHLLPEAYKVDKVTDFLTASNDKIAACAEAVDGYCKPVYEPIAHFASSCYDTVSGLFGFKASELHDHASNHGSHNEAYHNEA